MTIIDNTTYVKCINTENKRRNSNTGFFHEIVYEKNIYFRNGKFLSCNWCPVRSTRRSCKEAICHVRLNRQFEPPTDKFSKISNFFSDSNKSSFLKFWRVPKKSYFRIFLQSQKYICRWSTRVYWYFGDNK